MGAQEKIRVGVVGVGKMGRYHMQKYLQLPNAQLVGFCEPDPQRQRALSEEFKVPALSLAELLFEVDAISIASPTDTHAAIARQALEANVHILVEKPVAALVSDAEKLVALARRKQLVFQVGMVERFRLAALAKGVELQPVLFIETHRLSSSLSRESSIDVVSDLMIHDLDLALSLVSEDPISVSAIGMRVLTSTHDLANVRLEFPSGAVMNLNVSRVSADPVRKLRVFSSSAYASFDFMENTASVYRRTSQGVEGRTKEPEKFDALRDQIEDFLVCVREGRRPLVDGEDGVRALKYAQVVVDKIREREEGQRALLSNPRSERPTLES